ncbi:patatin-like phospholipase family protein [Ancylothrix sp. C2]|uniref:patatin-like phospholipase family protein n=1 Tax=Ancylothrix sp. D3o TaxID=2953691 RepID=UPI0021BB90D2|nr:patatin-like phospholipase family protein [Ancylothrix sp. D3o]MCT7952700.1 patatin-like phospholipase family protein [Ancylothrix sp. D3o]
MTVKRLLSIDGGGIRGIIAAEVLVQMEDALKAHNPKWKSLSNYFDFISGTSTGSIIAAGLATGMPARKILELYLKEGKNIFSPAEHTLDELLDTLGIEKGWGKRSLIKGLIKGSGKQDELIEQLLTKYTGTKLEKELQEKDVLSDITLGSSDLKTNLMIVTNNVTRGQNWFFVNNTVKGEYKKKSESLDLNADIPLWKIVRSSSAAPTFFPPFSFKVKVPKNHSSQEFTEQECEFIDGGVGPYNNSSFQLFLEAVHPAYGTAWDSGVDKILLVSVGTGYGYADIEFGEAEKKNNAQWAGYVVNDLMFEANLQQNQILKLISKQKKLKESANLLENGDGFKIVPIQQELLTYCRFTISFTVERFKALAEKGLLKDDKGNLIKPDAITKEVVDKWEKMDCVDQSEYLSAIGRAVAQEQFDISLFKGFLEDEVT